MVEAILTLFLLFVILSLTKLGRTLPSTAGFAIGATVTFDALVGGPLTGASMNPARSLGPAVVAGNLGTLWLYVTAPLFGSMAAVLFSSYLLKQKQEIQRKL